MIQTFALLLDSYRELNAKRLFWVVLGLTVLVVAAFASIGLSNGSMTVLGYVTPLHTMFLAFISPVTFYKWLFTTFGIGVWLSWIACILALVSTAGIFPDLMAGGSIDLYLAKPISRVRLFLTKVVGGLLFVTLQVTVFCACCFIVFRVRAGVWLPGVFIAVPLVVLMFSYLFTVCVLLGVVTRSTITALMLTLLFWFLIWAVQAAEKGFLVAQATDHARAARIDRQIPAIEAELKKLPPPTTGSTTEPDDGGFSIFHPFGGRKHNRRELEATLAQLHSDRDSLNLARFDTTHSVLAAIAAPLPKTSGTIEVLERQLVRLAELPQTARTADDEDADVIGPPSEAGSGAFGRRRSGVGRDDRAAADREVNATIRQRPAAYILGTSVVFEAVILGVACWLFCRRDY